MLAFCAALLLPGCEEKGAVWSARAAARQLRLLQTVESLLPQYPDSALKILRESEPLSQGNDAEIKALYHNMWGIYFCYNSETQKAIHQYQQVMAIEESTNLLPSMAKAANALGTMYSNSVGNSDSALKYLDIAMEIDLKRNDIRGVNKTKYDLAALYLRLDQYYLALDLILEVISYQESVKDSLHLCDSYNIVGKIMMELDDNKTMIASVFRKAEECARKTKNISSLVNSLNNLSSLFCHMPRYYDSTLRYSGEGLTLARQINDYDNIITLNTNAAYAHNLHGNADSTRNHLNEARLSLDKSQQPYHRVLYYIALGEILTDLDQLDSARASLDQSLNWARKIKFLRGQKESLQHLVYLSKREDRGAETVGYENELLGLQDSIIKNQSLGRGRQLQIFTEWKAKLNKIAQLEQERKTNLLYFLFFLAVSLLILVTLIALLLFRRNRELNIRKELAEQDLKIRDSEHRVAAIKQELTGHAFSLLKFEELMQKTREDITRLLPNTDHDTNQELRTLLRQLKSDADSKSRWREFEKRFNDLNDGYITKLLSKHPSLSPSEIRLCSLLRLQFSTKELADLSKLSPRTIEYTRASIRKKLGLNSQDNLIGYLLTI